ncbi:MAG TPA: hypothetical protein VMW27_10360 [Thermoanaerobaculia bacterium]|nr:hypothetical protein [Thermoanaerobaculia bacterium]
MCSETGRRFAKKTAFWVLAAVALGAGGCGKQGNPMPPVRDVPAPTRDLAVRQQGNRIVLDFAFPNVTPAGTTLGGLSGVEILGLTRDAPSQGKPAPIQPRELGGAAAVALRLETGDIAPSTVGDRLVIGVPLTEPLPATPQARYYAVRTIGPKGDLSEVSNVVAIVPKAPLAAPERITVTPIPEGVRVEWTPREGAAGYNVYRRGSQERGYSRSLQAGPGETSFVDTTAVFGQDYIYTVTAVAERDPLIESAVGSEYEVRYQDRFPPPPPADLVALAEGGQVRLIWRPAEGEDPAGYLVYRREQNGEFRRVTEQPIQETEYQDTGVAAGRPYSYRVTAVDALGNESAPGNEVAARLQ